MKRVWLICALAAFCAGCVAKKEPEPQANTAESLKAQREPLPLFHPDYKAGSPWHEYNEHTETNLRKFAELAKQVIAIKASQRDGVRAEEKSWLVFTVRETIDDVRWAFSGNLMETRSPGFTFVPLEYIFVCADGTEIYLADAGHYYAVSFPGCTWRMILATPEMGEAIASVNEAVFAAS